MRQTLGPNTRDRNFRANTMTSTSFHTARARSWRTSVTHNTAMAIACALVLLAPLSASRAETDCASLDIELKDPGEFTKVECDQGSLRHGDISGTGEVIAAQNDRSVFSIRHVTAGTHTYIMERDPRTVIESDLGKSDNWSTAPGGKGFAVMRFTGWLKDSPTLALSCFGFVHFSGHVDRSTGYRHRVSGFYCANQAAEIPDTETRRLIAAVKMHFE